METKETKQTTVTLDDKNQADLTKNTFLPHRFIILQNCYYYYYYHHIILVQILTL
jgi:hypothetical protein